MGYTTDFSGQFKLNKQIDFNLLKKFEKLNEGEDIGEDGQIDGFCQWMPTDDGMAIEWDGEEKFYEYVEWLQWIIDKLLKPNGYVLNGEVEWSGEEPSDLGKIIVKDNTVEVKEAKISYE